MTGCAAHPFDSDHGATCVLPTGHALGHRYESAWAPDGHTQEPNDE